MAHLRDTRLMVCAGLLGVVGFVVPGPAWTDVTCDDWNNALRVVGVPRLHDNRGGVEVQSTSGRVLMTRNQLGLGSAEVGDSLGAALSVFSANDGDQCADVAVGAPGADGTGVVYGLFPDEGVVRGGASVPG